MEWDVEYTDEFEQWWDARTTEEQEDVAAKVLLLKKVGPLLPRPHADTIKGSRHPNMKELIVQHAGDPYRVFFAFDPRRVAILLIGGCKAGLGDERFYREYVPRADELYDEHLRTLKREGVI